MTYVDGYVLPVKKSELKQYRAMAKMGAKMWKKHGALQYFECVGDDLTNKWGISFAKMARARPGETVVFSFITFKSKAHRNQVNKKVMSDPAMHDPQWKDKPMPFDPKRMAYGGFTPIVEVKA